jgi:hypothetical protein
VQGATVVRDLEAATVSMARAVGEFEREP